MFGKIMSISDTLMWRYFELLSNLGIQQIQTARSEVENGTHHPMELKKRLATELVARFHGLAAAQSALDYFETRHQKKSVPRNIRRQFSAPASIWICRLLVDLGFAKSGSEARRLIAQGAVKVDGQVISDVNFEFHGSSHRVVEVGKSRIAQAVKNS
jgi:tyrosyl-tRNA synthetase